MEKSSDVNPVIAGKRSDDLVEDAIRGLLVRQHGVVARAQLVALGLTGGAIDHRLDRGPFEAVHRSVYAWSRELLSFEGLCMAAVLTVGHDAVVSHQSAAALWSIRPGRSSPIHVTTQRKIRRRAGLVIHTHHLEHDERTEHQGIPITSPARTLFDMAAILKPQALTRAIREADYLRLSGGPSLAALSERYPGRAGARAVRAALDRGPGPPTRSELESMFLEFLDREELPRPEVNATIDLNNRRIEADFVWRHKRLVVELDGYRSHGTRHAFEDDRERDRLLQTAGWRVVRITWRQLRDEPEAIARDLGRLLAM